MDKQFTVVILGAARSGTSLITSIVHTLGINMGVGEKVENTREFRKNNCDSFQRKEFVNMNRSFIKKCKSHWSKVINVDVVLEVYKQLKKDMIQLIQIYNKKYEKWGWKDPRTATIINAWHPLLRNPYYIWIDRDSNSVSNSIIIKNKVPNMYEHYKKYADNLRNNIGAFVKDKKYIKINFEDLINKKIREETISLLGVFLGATSEQIKSSILGVE